MKLILLGPPGAGKGTQAEFLSDKLNIPNISTGEMLRQVSKEDNSLGEKLRSILASGALVSDDVIVEMVKRRLGEPDAQEGFILDGFPRTIGQAETLKKLLKELDKEIDSVICLQMDDDVLIERFAGRRVCKNCGYSYHIKFNPPKTSNICDKCGGTLALREDDKIETVKERLRVYHETTEPLINYYIGEKLLKEIDASQSIEEVFSDIMGSVRGEDQ